MFDVVHERSDRLTGSSRIGCDIYQYLLIEEIEQVAAMIDCQPRKGRDRRDAYAESLTPQRRIIIGRTIAALAAVFVMILLIDGLSGHWQGVYRDALRSIPLVTIPLLIWWVFLPILLAPKEPGE